MTLRCIACKTELDPVMSQGGGLVGDTNQPSGGLAFESYGAYGSTAFDPMNGEAIEVNVCDGCLVAAAGDEQVLWNVRYIEITCRDMVVGRQWVHRPKVPWKPELGHEDDLEIKIDVEEVGEMPGESIEWARGWREAKEHLVEAQRRDDALRDWALTLPVLALREMAGGMPGAHDAKQGTVVAWLMRHDKNTLFESWKAMHPGEDL